MRRTPRWQVPVDLEKRILVDGDWEDHSWDPITLSVIANTEYRGRHIPLAWQIEFEASAVQPRNAGTFAFVKGADADGYVWADEIVKEMSKTYPKYASELHIGDTETQTCVIWVESEEECKRLIQVAWSLIAYA